MTNKDLLSKVNVPVHIVQRFKTLWVVPGNKSKGFRKLKGQKDARKDISKEWIHRLLEILELPYHSVDLINFTASSWSFIFLYNTSEQTGVLPIQKRSLLVIQ